MEGLRGEIALVTGASGFVGGHAARRLAESEGMRVRALVRNPTGKTLVSLHHRNIEWVRGDLLDRKSLASACTDASLVFHAAVDTGAGDPVVARATIVDGTRDLYEAARIAGVERFIHMSGFTVYYGVLDRYEDEDTPLAPCGNLYVDAKVAAEKLLMAAPIDGPKVTILRAAYVYGPGSRDWSAEFFAKKGRLFLPGGGAFPFPYVYIDNLVDAVVAAARGETAGEAYNIVDGRTTYRDFIEPFRRMSGRKLRSIPFWALRLVATGTDVVTRLTGWWTPVSRGAVRVMMRGERRHRYATADKARRELGWEPRVDIVEGMRRTEEWLRHAGYIR